jgi:transcription antitermination protein NusB
MINPARRNARERALELLYEAEIKGLTVTEVLKALPVAPDPFAVALVRGVETNVATHDVIISKFLRSGWTLGRLPTIDKLIIRLGIEELKHAADVPTAVILDETVRLAKGFSTDESGRFVNGILAAIARSIRKENVDLTGIADAADDNDNPAVVVDLGQQDAAFASNPRVPLTGGAGVALDDEAAHSLD